MTKQKAIDEFIRLQRAGKRPRLPRFVSVPGDKPAWKCGWVVDVVKEE